MSIKSRRDFLKRSLLLAGGIAAQHLVTRVPRGLATIRQHNTHARPLKMLVLGDSVMWGQGLKEEHKFSYMVRDWLCEKRNGGHCADKNDVQLQVVAHSGATVYEKQGQDSLFLRASSPRVYNGEVNFPNPTIPAQIILAARRYAAESVPLTEVDLILVNGGINDMDATKLIIPRPFVRSVEASATLYCRDKMKDMLRDLVRTFPNARVLIPSYFPLVSDQTPATTVLDILRMAFPHHPQEAETLYRTQESPVFRRGLGVPGGVPHPIRHFLAKRSQTWAAASSDALRDAVGWLNTTRPLVTTGPRAGATVSRQRAWFVQVPFGPEHAYGTDDTYLWQLTHNQERVDCAGRSIAQNVQSDDELRKERACMCDQADKTNDLACLRAGFMHPNKAGAKAYRDAIVGVLERDVLPQTNWI